MDTLALQGKHATRETTLELSRKPMRHSPSNMLTLKSEHGTC